MKAIVRSILFYLRCLCLLPHLAVLKLCPERDIVEADIQRWLGCYAWSFGPTRGFLHLMAKFPEFRNVFYYRVGSIGSLLNILCPKMETLYICTGRIGKGLFIQHGFATIISAQSIGENCWINQQVTIGYSRDAEAPVIMDNVSIYAGAKVIGNVVVGSNSKVGANAVVIKDVPAGCTVVGVPAHIVKKPEDPVRNS